MVESLAGSGRRFFDPHGAATSLHAHASHVVCPTHALTAKLLQTSLDGQHQAPNPISLHWLAVVQEGQHLRELACKIIAVTGGLRAPFLQLLHLCGEEEILALPSQQRGFPVRQGGPDVGVGECAWSAWRCCVSR